MCGGGSKKSSQPVQQDVVTVANKPNRAEQAGTYTNTPGAVAANATPSQTFGSELGTGTGG